MRRVKSVEMVHISNVRVGDTVMHEGFEKTVCVNDIRKSPFMGLLLFGDCHALGTVFVERVWWKKNDCRGE